MRVLFKSDKELREKFGNMESLTENTEFSSKFSFDGIDWELGIRTFTKDNVKWLAVFLFYDSDNKKDKNWICEVDAKFRLLDECGKKKDLVKDMKTCFKEDLISSGFHTFIKWDELVSNENGYFEHNYIDFGIDFDFKYYDFSRKIPNFTDIIVNVEGTDFHLNKGVLCSKSEHFYDLFVNKKNKDKVVKLNGIKATDFGLVLASFNPFFDGVYENNYEELIKVAKQFSVSSLHYKCEQFLLTDQKIELIEKIKYADKNGYEKLMKSCIDSLKTSSAIKFLHANINFPELSEDAKLKIMQHFVDVD